MTWVDLGRQPEDADELHEMRAGSRHVGLALVGGGWVAFDLWCPHAECPLTDGWLEGTAVRCACHAGLFDLETGVALSGPTDRPLELFATRLVDGRIEVDLP
jgi:nitrite reductase/ring-hydroxylating ferredoxin subunit